MSNVGLSEELVIPSDELGVDFDRKAQWLDVGRDAANILTTLALAGVALHASVATARGVSMEGDFSLEERAEYIIAGQCERPDGGLLEDRFIGCNTITPGSIALVNIPGLTPARTDQQPYSPKEVKDYSTSIEGLFNTLQGSEDKHFRVTAITAPQAVSDTIRKNAKGYKDGKECFEPSPFHQLIVSHVLEEMPETRHYNYVVALGGALCPEPIVNDGGEVVRDNNGKPKTSDTRGISFLNTGPRQVDIYSHKANHKAKDGRLSDSNLTQSVLHELGHHEGLGHFGSVNCGVLEDATYVDLYELFSAPALQRQKCASSEYAPGARNIMTGLSNFYDKNTSVVNYLTPQQLDMLRHDTIANSTLELDEGQSATIDIFGKDETSVTGVLHKLDSPIKLELEDGPKEYDDVLLSVVSRNDVYYTEAALVNNDEGELTMMDAGQSTQKPVIEGEDGNSVVVIGDTAYVFCVDAEGHVEVSRMPADAAQKYIPSY